MASEHEYPPEVLEVAQAIVARCVDHAACAEATEKVAANAVVIARRVAEMGVGITYYDELTRTQICIFCDCQFPYGEEGWPKRIIDPNNHAEDCTYRLACELFAGLK